MRIQRKEDPDILQGLWNVLEGPSACRADRAVWCNCVEEQAVSRRKQKYGENLDPEMRHDRPGTMGFDDSPDKENYDPFIKEFTPTKAKHRKRYSALREITEKSRPETQEKGRASQDNESEMDILFSTFPSSPFKSRNIREL